MNIVNLFAGEGTWVRPWLDRGHSAWRTDIESFKGIDLVSDILDLKVSDIPEARNVVLASPDCTAFSVASLGTHWGGGRRAYEPKTPKAHNRMALVYQTAALIEALVARDGLSMGVIENPRGMLRKLGILDRYDNVTVSYCHYGDSRMKPTDLWGAPRFPTEWHPKAMCHNARPEHSADCCCRDHIAAPRGAKTGTQGLAKQERSFMPYELGLSVCVAAEKEFTGPMYRLRPVSPEGFAFYRSQVPARWQHFLTPYTPAQIVADGGTPYLLPVHALTDKGFGGEYPAAGFFLKNDGEIANVFSTASPGTGRELVQQAVKLGGNRVEYFEEPHLDELYGKLGFKETDRFPFDLSLIRQDFPDFDPDVSGTPDYVIARLT